MTPIRNSKWWGWGFESEGYTLPDPQHFWAFLQQTLGPLPPAPRVSSPGEISLPSPRLSPQDLVKLGELLGGGVSVDATDRLVHAFGKSYIDLLRIRQGRVEAAPEAVLFPEHEEQIREVLALAADRGWAIIPFGGGTSVVGGVEPVATGVPVLTLDMRRMHRVLGIDPTSRTARVQAGIQGPELEARLNADGFTLGHFPQSFEFSTLGGWIATRSAGQNSTKYGKIEHMVVSLRVVTPDGILDLPVVPADAAGPSLLQWFIGSEGTLGVITEAVVRLHPVPDHRAFASWLFADFAAGMTAVRKILQADLHPAVLRLSDAEETAMAMLLSQSPRRSFGEKIGRRYIRWRGFRLEQGVLLLLIFEGNRRRVAASVREARRFLQSGLLLGGKPARMWWQARFHHPYLRDVLMDRSVMIDTLETAAPWNKLPALYAAVRQALRTSLLNTAPGALVLTHLSHAYPDGASLYFTFMARQQAGQALEQWQRVKAAATEAILEHEGALSHHHGIGTMHKTWMRRYLGKEGYALLEHLKSELDPDNIMNPGKIV